jgi:DNA (cytosine-5)-methyltransferase 1
MEQQQLLPNFLTQIVAGNALSWHREMLEALDIPFGTNWPDRFGNTLREWLKVNGIGPIQTLSLFSGGGGLDIGFHDAGFHSVEMIELEAKYVKSLDLNARTGGMFEGSHARCVDIRNYQPPTELKVDFIIGGPPCQTFSAAGRRAAGVLGTSDPRGVLFEEYVRLLKTLKPRGFLFENVYGITGAQQGDAWKDIQDAFKEAGYTIFFRILDTADYGVPQHRERLFIVGLKEGEFFFPRPTHGPDARGNQPYYSAQEAVEGADATGVRMGLTGQYGHLLDDIPPGLNYSFYTEKMGHPNPVFGWRSKFSDFLYKADPATPVRTIKAQGGQYTGPFSWENRVFTIAELKRLQTIPDAYEVVGNRQVAIEQIGNSVPPQMARMLALSILDQVFRSPLPFPMHYLRHNEGLGFRHRKRDLTEVYAEKARRAIDALKANGTLLKPISSGVIMYEEIRYITPHFLLSHKKVENSLKLRFVYSLTEERWIVSAHADQDTKTEGVYEITVTPTPEDQWVLPTNKVILQAYSIEDQVFTALWKAFEEKVADVTNVADLVQLSGYYQYAPRFHAQMVLTAELSEDPHWISLQSVVNGTGVAKQMPEAHLALLLGIKADNLLMHLERLRHMGYEVRNNNTNPQIDTGDFLIPYAFPTLTRRSVQLRKNLRQVNG